jgi:hypothetical protein
LASKLPPKPRGRPKSGTSISLRLPPGNSSQMGYRAVNFGQEFDVINEEWQWIVSLRRLGFRDLRPRPANYDIQALPSERPMTSARQPQRNLQLRPDLASSNLLTVTGMRRDADTRSRRSCTNMRHEASAGAFT